MAGAKLSGVVVVARVAVVASLGAIAEVAEANHSSVASAPISRGMVAAGGAGVVATRAVLRPPVAAHLKKR